MSADSEEGNNAGSAAANLLGEIEEQSSEEPLITALRDKEPEVRGVASWALGKLKDPDSVDPLVRALEDIDKVIGFSEDGRLVAHTANDESCCGGINYTNNVVGVKDMSTGKDRTIFDEWARFGNKSVDPGNVEKVEWEDYGPQSAFFSPGNGLVALSVEKWSFQHPGTARMLTFIIPLAGSGKELVLSDRSAFGWLHDSALILTGGGSTFLFDMKTGEETLLLKPPAVPLTVAP